VDGQHCRSSSGFLGFVDSHRRRGCSSPSFLWKADSNAGFTSQDCKEIRQKHFPRFIESSPPW
jgi:hypothetical protein